MTPGHLGWIAILRLGLVQTALGAIVVLTTSTLNRVIVVELSLAATIPGALIGAHYAIQLLRPLWGHGSDRGGRRTPWILGGIALLAAAGTFAAFAVMVLETQFALGLTLAFVAFLLIGIGVGAAGTSLLALLAAGVHPARRPAAAMIVWVMMIAGMAVTAILAGSLIEPFSLPRLLAVTAGVGLVAFLVTLVATFGVERSITAGPNRKTSAVPFRRSLADAWADRDARLFTIFVFVSMLAYSAQDLILEPYGGLVFGMSPGETTRLAGLQHGGVFAGMILAGLGGSLLSRRFPGVLRVLTVVGCLMSATALAGIAMAGQVGPGWPLVANVALLGFANGVFAVAAIGSMMALAGAAGTERSGMRMGLWGGAQAVAFGLGGFSGTVAVDLVRLGAGSTADAYGLVFLGEAAIFVAAALLALRIGSAMTARPVSGLVAAE